MLGASLVGAFAVARLASGVGAAAIVTAGLGALTVAALRRRPALAVVAGVVVAGLCSLGAGVHDATRHGFLSWHSVPAVRTSLRVGARALAAFHLPLVHTPGIVVLCTLVAGLQAVAGRAIGTRFPALAVVPGAGLLVCSAILLPTTGAAVGGLVLGGCGFLVIGGQPDVVRRAVILVAAASLAAGALAVLWTTTGTGSGAVTAGGRTDAGVSPSALALATDLTGVETRDANVVLFEATTPVSTYWQVTALTTFTGDGWVPDAATEAMLRGGPVTASPAPTASSGPHLFAARVTVAGYVGRILPAPPSTVAATGSSAPVLTSSGVVATSALGPGSRYVATAVVPAAVADSATGSAPPTADTVLGPVPPSVRSLALSVTGQEPTTLEKAEALTDFFRSGRFHYSITAPAHPDGNSLVSFLTETHTGSCEQFASAFAVLARASGVPARVAIGFTPGRSDNGTTVVRGRDAHAWPQVLIDGSWVSFEPTPQLPSGELSPPGVLGPTGLGRPNPTGPGTIPTVSIPKPVVVNPTAPPATLATPPTAGHHAARPVGWIVAIVLLVAALAALARWLSRRRSGLDRVVGSWKAIDRALARRGLARPASATPAGHVRALSVGRVSDEAVATLADMDVVATILQDVTYGFTELGPDDVARAARASRRARRAILSGSLAGSTRPGFVVSGEPDRPVRSADDRPR